MVNVDSSSIVAFVDAVAYACGSFAHVNVRAVDVVVHRALSFAIAWCLCASWATSSYSYVDQIWSIAPVTYVAIYAYDGRLETCSTRLFVMSSFVALWGTRLTYNFYRKGGYAGVEDYRWATLRKHWALQKRLVWETFNVTFIAWYQNVLLLLIALPAAAARRSEKGFNVLGLDGAASALWFAAFVVEVVADEQQWRFQQSKHGKAPRVPEWKEDYDRGFLTHGLFRYSRHPNFFAEQAMWVAFSLFAGASSTPSTFIHPTMIGAVLLIMLFQGSTRFTESITSRKYVEYRNYQACTSALIPMPRFGTLPKPKAKQTATRKSAR